MVSAGVCFGGKGRLHFVDESAKVDSAYYRLAVSFPVLSTTALDCCPAVARLFFQQDGAPAHTACATQNWLQINCPDFIAKDQWPPNSPLGLPCLGAMLEAYHKRHPKPKTIVELKEVLQVIWDSLSQRPIGKAVKEFSKRLKA